MSEIEEVDPHERTFGVSREVWSSYQKAREGVFLPDRRAGELWIEHWRQIENIADFQIQNGRTLDESIQVPLSKARERIGQALAKGDYNLFYRIAEFIQHGEHNDKLVMAPIICSAFHQLLDEYRESPEVPKCPITKKDLKERASRIMATHRVREEEPEERKAFLFKPEFEGILKEINWARELNRLGLSDLPEADSSPAKSGPSLG
jgi:hypothetical protein